MRVSPYAMPAPSLAYPACDPAAAADLLRALAHPMRLMILCRLLDGEAGVSELEQELGLRQPNLSQQLAALREADLVSTRRESRRIIYQLTDPRVRPIIETLYRVFATGNARPTPAPPHAARAETI